VNDGKEDGGVAVVPGVLDAHMRDEPAHAGALEGHPVEVLQEQVPAVVAARQVLGLDEREGGGLVAVEVDTRVVTVCVVSTSARVARMEETMISRPLNGGG
jgi:hypothetical protein